MKRKVRTAALAILAGTFLTSCNHDVMSEQVARRLSSPVWMNERIIPAGPFALTAYERMHQRHAPANLYIEGDGKAWLSKREVSRDPTPSNPVALHLATKDKAENVAYLARPCQFTRLVDESKPCNPKYWTGRRFSPEVIDAYHTALDDIKKQYNITAFNLIGYSGGGAIATILAGQRDDILTIRTVAGNLDHKVHSQLHGVSFLEGSVNPPDYAGKLRAVPQVHFIGGQDAIVPPAILQSYLQALEPTTCVKHQFIQEAEHDRGWVEKWPHLLKIMPACGAALLDETDVQVEPEPVYRLHEQPK